MADPRDAIRSLRAVPSVPDRLARVEEEIRSLARVKDRHAALLQHLTDAVDERVDRLDSRLDALEALLRRRDALESESDAAIDVRVIGFDAVRGLAVAVDTARRDGADLVALVRRGDRTGRAWPRAGGDALATRPTAIAAYGERIDVLRDGTDALDATVVTRYEPDAATAADPGIVIDLGSVVVRTDALASVLAGLDDAASQADVVRALVARGEVVAVPVTATVGPHRDPTT